MFIVICGATASGKSELAIALAREIGGEIVSADSMQIYRGMDVGTAKITVEEMQGIPHHMINMVDPTENYSVAEYAYHANKVIKNIQNRGKTPIICGGTGLYINALVYGYNMSSYNIGLRNELYKELEIKGIDYMYEKLLSLDPLAASIHKNNTKRVIRALEVVIGEGKSILSKDDRKSYCQHLMYATDMERAVLYDRIDRRVDIMFDMGLVDEVNALVKNKNLNFDMQSMQAIGYREFRDFFDGIITLEEVKNLIKQHSRNYAKRQLTWFKRNDTCNWLKFGDNTNIINTIKHEYYNKVNNLE